MGDSGSWNVHAESGTLESAHRKIVFRLQSRDLQMALNPAKNGTPVRHRLKLNAAAPDDDDGSDSGADGTGEIRQAGCIIATFYGNRLWI